MKELIKLYQSGIDLIKSDLDRSPNKAEQIKVLEKDIEEAKANEHLWKVTRGECKVTEYKD